LRLSVVIPAYNEEARLGATLDRVADYLEARGDDAEILVADDGSTDRTAACAEQRATRGVRVIRLAHNQGKGAAARAGALESTGDLILLTDADLSTPIEELEKLEAALGDAALAVGSRAVAEADVAVSQPLYRVAMGKVFNRLIWLLGVRGIHDTQCGFKLLRGDVGRQIFRDVVTTGFAFDVELVWLASQRGLKVVETGVIWRNAPGSKVDVLRDPPRMLLDIRRFQRHHRQAGTASRASSA
jgi:dolichyl-phosphate beta-glucosyltransferase